MVKFVPGTEGDGGAGGVEKPREPGYVSYVLALLCMRFLNDKSGYAIYC